MRVFIKTFSELTTKELYQILRLRSEVFVVEQNCVYQDIDKKDEKAIHIFGVSKNIIIAYTRCFQPGAYFKEASIGRVVVQKNQRKLKRGNQIMLDSIRAIETLYHTKLIRISAQCYLKIFYNNLDFYSVGDEYLEDGIPHINMIRK
ncbi:GNAT family N-acetyltransferase [Flavobacteriaceae bacterium]|nr:GNAT family N-acetyltransferase [Flavobacteriaceae bacterium]|tara:strand:+ start:789 stop:1229 length:441 start_codon:yes stop_codon:yes gene_type:complete